MFIKILLLIIIILFIIYILKKSYYVEKFDNKQNKYTILSMDHFNIAFNSKIITLPKKMYAAGVINNKWYLGHNNPEYEIKYNFLFNSRFWLHAKNGEVFDKLLKDKNYNFNVFWHTTEDWVLTSKKYIWTYPNKKLFVNSICVLPELGYKDDLKLCYGICSDYVEKHKLESTKDLQI
jgi:hypothetical protein